MAAIHEDCICVNIITNDALLRRDSIEIRHLAPNHLGSATLLFYW
jgi:hypothetical protein